MRNERLRLLTRCPIWAILPESFAALLMQLTSRVEANEGVGPFVEEVRFLALNAATALNVKGNKDNKVAIIPVQGVLTRDEPWAGTTYSTISNSLDRAASDPSIKRIVLDVDSPGGEVTGLPETAALLAQVGRSKHVSAMVDGNSASAAYWLTSQAKDITIAPSAEVGSVGVRIMHVDISKALADAGLKVTELYSGNFKTEWSPFQPLSEEALGNMQGKLTTVHNDFIKAVAEGRGTRPTADITSARYGEGRMFSAAEAMGHGLADAVQSPREFYRGVIPPQEAADTGEKALPKFPIRGRLDVEGHRF